MDASKEVARWRGTIADLNRKREAAEGRIEKLRERKKPLTLRAHTGDEPARKKLAARNAELLTERQGLEDLEEAVRQAGTEFVKAEEARAVEVEAERLRLLARLATERVKVAALVDQTARALAQALAGYDGIGDQIYRHVGSSDVKFGGKVRSTGRVDVALATHLAAVTGCVSRNPHDPRDGQTLEVMEEEPLAILLIDPDKAYDIANMNPGDTLASEPENEPERSAA